MDNEKEVMDYFRKEIENIATQKQEAILKEVEGIIEQAKKEYTETALKTNELHFQREKEVLDREQARKMAELNTQKKSRIAHSRKKMEEEVFLAIKEKLIAFCATKTYLDKLQAVIEVTKKSKQPYLLHLNKRDLHNLKQLEKQEANITFIEDDAITIGGYILVNQQDKTLIDESYDTLLEDERTYFYKHSHLLIDK